jgi:aminopeptidase N
MIGYFSKLLGVEYPWDKYSQIVVRDYVSGAMENTGAVVFGDFVYKTDRELLDANDQSTIAHELFHHWFGDLVTCESWSNLTVNESFANYSQYLWDEHRFGLDEAEYQAIQEANGYFASAEQSGYHNLVWFDYNSREDMFDGHSYNKGGRILHMLRKFIGDSAFFDGLQNYLKTNQFKTGEFHQMRLALEETSGQDLNWFFNQWYLGKGHPILTVNYSVKADSVYVNVDQTQKKQFGLFKLPINISVFDDRGETKNLFWFNDEKSSIAIPIKGTVKNVLFDTDASLLGKVTETKDASWYVHQWNHAKRYIQRKTALLKIAFSDPETQRILSEGLNDPFWDIRSTAVTRISKLAAESRATFLPKITSLATSDPNSMVRIACVNALKGTATTDETKQLLLNVIQKDQSYSVVAAALTQLSTVDNKAALEMCSKLENEPSGKMQIGVSTVYAKYAGPEAIQYFEKLFKSNTLQGFDEISALSSLTYFASLQDNTVKEKALGIYKDRYASGGMYTKMFMPQYVDYIIEKLQKDTASSSSTLLEQYKAFAASLDRNTEFGDE